ncbi:unnamed protein product [Cercospora beticola]|nr:unnamed protein product [Cercospora beticola]
MLFTKFSKVLLVFLKISMATLSLQAPAGNPHCTVFSFLKPPTLNTNGRVVVTSNINTINNPLNSRHFTEGGMPSIDFDIRAVASLHNPNSGRLVTLTLRNRNFQRHTVILEQFRSTDNPLTSTPFRVHEFIVPAADPGAIWDNPGTATLCIILQEAVYSGWALQVRGPT